MNPLLGHAILLAVFSLVLGGVVSAYRDEEPARILRGTLRRALLFALAVAAIGVLAVVTSNTVLKPGP